MQNVNDCCICGCDNTEQRAMEREMLDWIEYRKVVFDYFWHKWRNEDDGNHNIFLYSVRMTVSDYFLYLKCDYGWGFMPEEFDKMVNGLSADEHSKMKSYASLYEDYETN